MDGDYVGRVGTVCVCLGVQKLRHEQLGRVRHGRQCVSLARREFTEFRLEGDGDIMVVAGKCRRDCARGRVHAWRSMHTQLRIAIFNSLSSTGAARWRGTLRRRPLASLMNSLLTSALLLLVAACSAATRPDSACRAYTLPPDQFNRASIGQGVAGNVWDWRGQFPQCGTVEAVSRLVLIFPLTAAASLPGLAGDEYFVDVFPGVPLDSARSDSAGFFEVALPVGNYTVVVREANRLYVRVSTANFANIGEVAVVPAVVTVRNVWLTYRATF